jgi:hypothetical protein
MAAALALALFLAPSPTVFVDGISSRNMWAGLNHRLLPAESWFGLGPALSRIAGHPTPATEITTGTLPAPAAAAPEAQPKPPAGP